MTRTLAGFLLTAIIASPISSAEKPRLENDFEPRLRPSQSWERTEFPDDSPYWWTLSDELTPSEFREKMSRAAAQATERIREEAYDDPGRDSYMVAVFDGREDPDFLLLWEALAKFARLSGADMQEVKRTLKSGGLSSSGADLVATGLAHWRNETSARWEELTKSHEELTQLRADVVEKHGEAITAEIWETNDIERLAQLSGRSVADLRELIALATQPLDAEVMLPVLADLRNRMTRNDWVHLRFYLREEIARNTTLFGSHSFPPDKSLKVFP